MIDELRKYVEMNGLVPEDELRRIARFMGASAVGEKKHLQRLKKDHWIVYIKFGRNGMFLSRRMLEAMLGTYIDMAARISERLK